MALILKRGQVPAVPHTEFHALPGVLALEEIHGTYGFSGAFSRKYHLRSYPTETVKPPRPGDFDLTPRPAQDARLQPYHLLTGRMPAGGDPIRSRRAIVFGPHTTVSIAKPDRASPQEAFFRNGEKHELYFVQEGAGILESEFGDLAFRKGQYLVVPKGTTYRIALPLPSANARGAQGEGRRSSRGLAWFLVIESTWPIRFPPHYLNDQGQAKMTAPVVESEIQAPTLRPPVDRKGAFAVDVKHGGGRISRLTLGHHPFDLAGWEGALYPFAFSVESHHGIAREIHTAPPMHQTFEAGNPPHGGFSVCSFVPQMEGWHPKEVPAPYAHFNVDSDEVMFFCNARYGARKGVIQAGSFTFHPGALPHSPQGQAALRSLAARGKISDRLAVMLDTAFESLAVTAAGYKYRDPGYPLSWHRAAAAAADPAGTLHGT